jgi:hypothetical protein
MTSRPTLVLARGVVPEPHRVASRKDDWQGPFPCRVVKDDVVGL